MRRYLALIALLLAGCGRVTFGGGIDSGAGFQMGENDAGTIAITVATDAAGATDHAAGGAPGTGGASGRGGAPDAGGMMPPMGGAGGTSGCQSLADCKNGVCNLVTRRCVGCLVDGDCKSGKANLCDTAALTCVECRSDADCDGDKACRADGTCGP